MKIILLKDVKKQGKKGDIKEVKDGYGMFLIKNGDAVNATQTGMNRLKKETEQAALQESLHIKECEKIKEGLEKIILEIPVKTGEMDRVFGSVSTKQIVNELKKNGFDIDKKNIELNGILSCLGIHQIKVNLHKQVIATLKIKLVKQK